MRYDEDDDDVIIEMIAPCGDAIEIWEPVPQITSWCDLCREYHVYKPQE